MEKSKKEKIIEGIIEKLFQESDYLTNSSMGIYSCAICAKELLSYDLSENEKSIIESLEYLSEKKNIDDEHYFDYADDLYSVIISDGHGNYFTLSHNQDGEWYLLPSEVFDIITDLMEYYDIERDF